MKYGLLSWRQIPIRSIAAVQYTVVQRSYGSVSEVFHG